MLAERGLQDALVHAFHAAQLRIREEAQDSIGELSRAPRGDSCGKAVLDHVRDASDLRRNRQASRETASMMLIGMTLLPEGSTSKSSGARWPRLPALQPRTRTGLSTQQRRRRGSSGALSANHKQPQVRQRKFDAILSRSVGALSVRLHRRTHAMNGCSNHSEREAHGLAWRQRDTHAPGP